MPAHATAAAIRAGDVTAAEVAAAALAALETSELNACTAVHHDRALRRAADIDAAIAAGRDPGPLAGIPIAIKDLIDHEGETTTAGSAFYRHEAEASATAVTRLEAAGAVIVGRTNLHEFAYGFSSENPWFGPVRNPWDPATSAGGSSGGSGAAVAGGLVPIAIGTDTGGSVRVPAALCGVLGLKVTHGRIPLTGVVPLAASLDTVGPIATSVRDLDLAYRAMAGHDPADPWSIHAPPPPPTLGTRIGIPRPWVGDGPVDPDVTAGFEAFGAAVTAVGFEVVDLDVPNLVPWGRIAELSGAQAARVHREWMAKDRPYGDEVRRRLEAALSVTVDELVDALAWQASMQDAAREAFARVDLLATPSVGTMTKVIGQDDVVVGDRTAHYRQPLSWFSALVNSLGTPALAAPLAGTGGPPHSIQLVAPWWAEADLLATGQRLEREGIIGTRLPHGAWWLG